jgi:hypothetical protein
MARNFFDQASRYAAKLDPPGFLSWLLGVPSVAFRGWLDTRRIPFPGETDRTCDTVAHLDDPARPGTAWAAVVEFQIEPRADLTFRLLIYLGQLGLEERPADGQRFEVGAIVVNLTGAGQTSCSMQYGGTAMVTRLGVAECDMGREKAADVLAGIEAGRLTRCLLPWVPLMHGGAEPGIIHKWLDLARAEPDDRRRGDFGGLALVFAEAADRSDVWKQALKGWNMVESQQVLEWMAQGKAEGGAEMLLRVLRNRFGPLPVDLETAVRSTTNLNTLETWVDLAMTSPALADFRRDAQV